MHKIIFYADKKGRAPLLEYIKELEAKKVKTVE